MNKTLSKSAERSKASFQRKAAAALSGHLEPGERIIAETYGMVRPPRGTTLFLGGFSGLAYKHYWLTATDRKLYILRMSALGTSAEIENASLLSSVQVIETKDTFMDVRLALDVSGHRIDFRFPGLWKQPARAICSALGRSL